MPPDLEPDRTTLEAWLAELGRFALDAISDLDQARASGLLGPEGLAVAREVSQPITDDPLAGGLPNIISILERAALAAHASHGPGFLAYIPGGGLPSAALADLVADLLNRYTGVAAAAPALCRLEADVLAWLASAFGYGSNARGLLTSGGSLANFSAVVTARRDRLGTDGDYRHAMVYTSAQAHHSVAKAVMLAGIPPHNVRAIATDARLRMDPDALAESITVDRTQGARPFLVVSTAGTTNTGAVDPLPAISQICQREQLWHHVDAAYGGAFVLCEQGRVALAGIDAADSIAFDPHKGMFLPYGTGCLLVADGERLRRAHQVNAAYLQDFDAHDRSGEPPSPSDYGPELSRDYRGLRLWLPLMLHGVRAFRDALTEKLALTREFARQLRTQMDAGVPIELVDDPQLTVAAFRLARAAGEPLAAWNHRNAAWLARINARARVCLSSTALPVADGEAFTLRACVLSFRTHAPVLDACLQDVLATLR